MDQITFEGNRPSARATPIAKTAVVVGAGIAGLTAAGALADWFEQVVVLDRDPLPDSPLHRPSTPQSRHSHGLLVGGLLAQDALFPGIAEDFASAGAVPVRINRDLREEPAHRAPMPQRDFGRRAFAMSRPLLEFTLRGRAAQLPNVTFRPGTRVIGLISEQNARRVTGVRCTAVDGHGIVARPTGLVIDASSRGHLTAAVLQCMGHERPRETVVGIDLRYTTAVLPVPDNAPADWKLVLTHHDVPRSSRRAILLPMEGDRWMLSTMGRGKQEPPVDLEERLRFAGALSRVAARDAAVQRLVIEVWHMLRPRGAYQDPELVRLIEEEMAMA